MREIKRIYIHCSDTYPDQDIGLAEITSWHTDPPPRGNGWSRVGYHYVIRRDGSTEVGLPHETIGAHVRGHNHDSIGICLVGGKARPGKQPCNFTAIQWWELSRLVRTLANMYPGVEIMGHNDSDSGKTCPTFDAKEWWVQ